MSAATTSPKPPAASPSTPPSAPEPLQERPALRPCLLCGVARLSTRSNRLHPRCAEKAAEFDPSTHGVRLPRRA
jgi:hypothetical protein